MASNPQQAAADWASGLAAKTAKITAGAEAVTVAPGQAAARQKQAWLNNVNASADKWATNTARVTREEWLAAFKSKGVPRIASGAQAAQPKFQAFMTDFLPFLDRARGGLPPRGTFEQNMQRAVAMMTAVHGFRRSGG